MHRKFASLLLAAALLPALSLSALAAPEEDGVDIPEAEVSAASGTADIGYSGALDPLTGLPAGSRLTGNTADYYTLKSGAYGYDLSRGVYVNELGALSFTSSIPNGALLNAGEQTVSFSIPAGLSAVLYRSGNAVADADLSNITEAGSYLLEVTSSGSGESVSFPFRLLGELTGNVSEISLPAGFSFTYLRLNGEEQTTEYDNYTPLNVDGEYEFGWACKDIGRYYTTHFTLDTVPPTLALPEVVNGEAHAAVTLTDLEEGAHIVLTEKKSGETSTILFADTEIRDAGTYHLTVYDRTGNSTAYDFTIHVYFNISALAAIALALAGIAGLVGYSRYIRRNPRVG